MEPCIDLTTKQDVLGWQSECNMKSPTVSVGLRTYFTCCMLMLVPLMAILMHGEVPLSAVQRSAKLATQMREAAHL